MFNARLTRIICALTHVALAVSGLRAAEPGSKTGAPQQASIDDNWPAFLGPFGTGVIADRGIADRWPEGGPPVVWRKRIGEGYSAPSVLGGKLVYFQQSRVGESVACVRADDGRPIWEYDYRTRAQTPQYGDGPRATPLLTDKWCYTYGVGGKLLCLDLKTGKEIWSRETVDDFDTVVSPFGIGASPALERQRLIVFVGGRPNSAVVAFQAETGQVVWQSVGKDTWNGVEINAATHSKYEVAPSEELVSYSSPLVATIHGRRQILCLVRQGLVSLDPTTGGVNFKYLFLPRPSASVTAARPVVFDDRIFLTASYRLGCALIQVDRSGQSVKEIWRNKNLDAHWSTPLYIDGFIYGFRGRDEPQGELVCLDAKTGKIQWKTRGYEGPPGSLGLNPQTGEVRDRKTGKVVPFPYFGRGSLTLAGKRLIILGERGTLALAEPSPNGYREICRASVPGVKFPVWPSPVLAGTKLYIRDTRSLVCLDMAAGRRKDLTTKSAAAESRVQGPASN
jgi:outer membrane protein assembly factor BamB